ncbi:hypothetical protein C0J52_12389 [Blattella germanica]|nr:hypothetical protein C0J52_12389 [Blattella germanica]
MNKSMKHWNENILDAAVNHKSSGSDIKGRRSGYLRQILRGDVADGSTIHLSLNHIDLVGLPNDIEIEPGTTQWTISLSGLNAGHAILNLSLDEPGKPEDDEKFVRITIQHDEAIHVTSIVIGWIYFAAWSVSFYPQIYENWKRKSVVGLNFDFVSLNIVGFLLYSLFNCGLYWIPVIEEEYMRRYPRGLNPVQLNDIVFSLHAALATFFMIIQCFIYERGNQKISWTARVIHGAFTIFLFINDWESIFGDPTKFGLGLFSVVFDVFFIIQHYVLYSINFMYLKFC